MQKLPAARVTVASTECRNLCKLYFVSSASLLLDILKCEASE